MSWTTNAAGECQSVTQAWSEFTGRSREHSAGMGWLRCIHALDIHRFQAALHTAHHSCQPMSVEYRLRRADGTYGWVQHEGLPQQNGEGGFQGFVHVAIDVVGTKRLEQALLDKQAELRQQRELTNGLMDVMAVVNMRQSVATTLKFLVEQAVHMLNAQIGIFFQFVPGQQHMQVHSSVGLALEISQQLNVYMGEGTAGCAAQQRRVIALDSIEVEGLERILLDQPELWESVISLTQNVARSVAAPIIVQDKLLGVLAIYRRESISFVEEDANLLAALGIQAGLVIQSDLVRQLAMPERVLTSSSDMVLYHLGVSNLHRFAENFG